MYAMLITVAAAFLAGVAGTGAGGLVGAIFKPGRKIMNSLMDFAAGIMTAVVCFDMLPSAAQLTNVWLAIAGAAGGALAVMVVDKLLAKAGTKRTGVLMGATIALHNLPEGIAIGSAFSFTDFGLALCILVALHDIPEGLAMAIPLRVEGTGRWKSALWAAISGIPTAIGALIGYAAGAISVVGITISISVAAGAMLYVIYGRMLPETDNSNTGIWSLIAGILAGMLLIFGL